MKLETVSLVYLQGMNGVTFEGINRKGAAVMKLSSEGNYRILDFRKKVVAVLSAKNFDEFLDVFTAPALVSIAENGSGVHITLRDTKAFPRRNLWLMSDFSTMNTWPVLDYVWEHLTTGNVAIALYDFPYSSYFRVIKAWVKNLF